MEPSLIETPEYLSSTSAHARGIMFRFDFIEFLICKILKHLKMLSIKMI